MLKKFAPQYEEEVANYLSAAVVNRLFSERPGNPDSSSFLQRNKDLVEREARAISRCEELCNLITGSLYSACYARHIEGGGKTSWWRNPYLGYIRALSRSLTDPTYIELSVQMSEQLELRVIEPLVTLLHLGVFRPLPRSPDSKEIYARVHAYAMQAGVEFD